MSYQLDFSGLTPYLPQFVAGLGTTVELTIISTVGGLLLGTLCAGAKTSQAKWLKFVCTCYIEVIRNTPFIVQLFFIFFGLPALGIKLSAWQAGVIAMVINLGAYSAEIIRAGIEATPKGQWEAGRNAGIDPHADFYTHCDSACVSTRLSGDCQPVHHCDVGFCGGVTNFGGRSDVCGQLRPVAQFSEF